MSMFKFRSTHDPVSPLIRTRPEDNARLRAFTAADDRFSVYVHAEVLDFIERQAALAGNNEAIGLLAGRICNDPRRGPFTLVMAAADAREGEFNASPSFVRLLPVGHTSIRRRLSEAHPDREIVGWYHTHPHWQPRFSEVDLEQQRNWEDPNHVGIVYGADHNGEPFGVYQGPQAILLSSTRVGGSVPQKAGIEVKQLAQAEPKFSTPVLTPEAESAALNSRLSVPLPSSQRKPEVLRLMAAALMFLILVLVLALFHRRVSSLEKRLSELSGRQSSTQSSAPAPSNAAAAPTPLVMPAASPAIENEQSQSSNESDLQSRSKSLMPATKHATPQSAGSSGRHVVKKPAKNDAAKTDRIKGVSRPR